MMLASMLSRIWSALGGAAEQVAGWRDSPLFWLVLAALLLAGGLWALQPGARRGRRFLGGLACLAGLTFCVRLFPPLNSPLAVTVIFRCMAALALISAVATVTSRNPVYSAIWFALTLIGTAFLMLLLGGQFVAVATVAVYAGAIVVTFLFVLMLAQSGGRAPYDRISWGAIPAWWVAPAAVLLFVLLVAGLQQEGAVRVSQSQASATAETGEDATRPITARAAQPGSVATWSPPVTPPGTVEERFSQHHVAQLGGELFSRYLIPVQVVATLLLSALVGAVAIASYPPLPETQEVTR